MTSCDRWGHGGCRGEVREIRCDEPGCEWVAHRCEEHSPRQPAKTVGRHRSEAHPGKRLNRDVRRARDVLVALRLVAPASLPDGGAPVAVIAAYYTGSEPLTDRMLIAALVHLERKREAHRVGALWHLGPGPAKVRGGYQPPTPTPPMRRCRICAGLVWERDLRGHLECLHGITTDVETYYQPIRRAA